MASIVVAAAMIAGGQATAGRGSRWVLVRSASSQPHVVRSRIRAMRLGGGLLERERELATVEGLVGLARAGSGRVLLVLGPAGIGKTGLLAASAGIAREAGLCVCQAVAGELECDLAWGVVRQLFAGFRRGADGPDGGLFGGAAGLALPVLGFGQAAVGVDALSPALHGLYWLTANLSERGPVLLVVDDAQWADPASVRFLHYLSRRLEDLPVLLAVAIRSCDPGAGERAAAFRALAGVTVLEPAPLSVAAGERMLRALLGRAAERQFALACHAASGGNPYLLSELGAQLAVDAIEPTAASASQVSELSPRSVAHWVLLRVSRLPVEAQRLAEAVAVLGGRAQLAHSAAVADIDLQDAAPLADALFAAGVLSAGVPLDFVHPLVRAAVYSEMSPLAREAAHARAARLLAAAGGDQDAVAAQLMQTRPAADAWVVDALIAAAASARERGAPEAAVAWLRRALTEPPEPQRRPAVLLQLGVVEAEISDPAALEHLRDAHECACTPVERARAAIPLAGVLLFTNRLAEAFESTERAVTELGGRDRELELQLETLTIDGGWLGCPLGDAGRRRAQRFTAADFSGRTLGERMILEALAAQITFSGRQPASAATELIGRALTAGRFAQEFGPGAPQFWQAMYLLHAADELDLAERAERQPLEVARKRGSLLILCLAAIYRAHLCLQRGWVHAAGAEVDQAYEFGDHVWIQGNPLRVHIRLEVLLEQGRLAEAEIEAARLDAVEAPPTSMTRLFAVCSRGRLRVAQGRFEDALADLLGVGRDSLTPNPAVFAWRSRAAPALAALGRREEARALLAQELELARCFGVARPIGVNLRATGVLEGRDDGIELLRESVRVLEGCPSSLERAHSLVELGSALRRSSRRAESLPSLREGLDLAEQSGASALARRARRELLDAGARPHRPALFGRDALTPSELRVSQMAAEGASNKEIAQALFVSLRTVETHLTHTYSKLDVSARQQLAGALAANTVQPPGSTAAAPSQA